MRIWIVNPYDDIPGEGARQRYWTLSEQLAARGHDVTWWSSVWSHRRKTRREIDPDQTRAFDLQLMEASPYHRNVGLERIRNHREFARSLRQAGDARLSTAPPELVVVSWPPIESYAVAASWRERCCCRVALDVMDAWPDNFLMLAPALPGAKAALKIALGAWAKSAREACQGADGVSAQSTAFAQWAQDRGAGRVYVCYLGANSLRDDGVDAENRDESLRLLYLGAMGRAYDLETLVRAVAMLRKKGANVRLDLAGEGAKEAALKQLAHELGVADAITFHGYVQGDAIQNLLVSADLGVIPMFPESLVAVPYKAGEYLAAGLPIINSLPGELERLLAERSCGAFYQAGDVNSLAGAISRYIQQEDQLSAERQRARGLFAERFDRTKTYESWADWIEQIAQSAA